jgi:hypothetical protein
MFNEQLFFIGIMKIKQKKNNKETLKEVKQNNNERKVS